MSKKLRLAIPIQTGPETIHPAGTQVIPAGGDEANRFLDFLLRHRSDVVPKVPFTFKLVWLGGGLEALDPEMVVETDL